MTTSISEPVRRSNHGVAAYRRDAFSTSKNQRTIVLADTARRARKQAQGAPSMDVRGRFVGRRDVERGADFFWASRADFRSAGFNAHGNFAPASGLSPRPAPLRCAGRPPRSALPLAVLLAIDAAARAGESLAAIGRRVGLGRGSIAYHVAGSTAMRAARAGQFRQATLAA